ncbi:hypothetical protein [Streptomyces sp. TE33382]
MIERRTTFYEPYMEVIGIYTYTPEGQKVSTPAREPVSRMSRLKEEHEVEGYQVGEPPPAYNYGTDVADPPHWEDGDSRGWHCDPVSGCEWSGVI